MKNVYIAIFVIMIILFSSCSEAPTEYTAENMTLSQIIDLPGFGWFNAEYVNYVPKADDIATLQNTDFFSPETDKFLIFAQPAGSCEGDFKDFPEMIKTIEKAGFTEENIIIYLAPNVKSKHPYNGYEELSPLPKIPSFYILRNNIPHTAVKYRKGANITFDTLIKVE